MQLNELNIDIGYYPWMFINLSWLPRKSDPGKMIGGANNFIALLIL